MSTDGTPEVLSYARIERPENPRLILSVRTLLAVGWVVCALGTVAVLLDVKSILVSGPTLGSVGLTTFVLATIARRRHAAIVGLLNIAICVVFVVVVYVFDIGPGNAEKPFLMMAAIYTAAIAWPTKTAFIGLHIPPR